MRRYALLGALALFAVVWFANLDYRSIVKADEGRYAEIAREMVASGDWLTPRLNGFKYFEKPVLQHWATATAFTVFGVNEWTARLWTALCGFLGVLLIYFAGNRAFGPPAGLYAALVAASSALYVFVGHFLSLDMGVTFFMTLAVLAFMAAQLDGTGPVARRNYMLAGWVAMALAVLSKGLIGIVLPVAAAGVYVLVERDWRRLLRLHLVSGLALFLLVAAPWFVAVSLANPEFFRFFFIQEHYERFFTTMHGRYEPAWYFVPVLAAGVMPWLPAAVPALWRAWTDEAAARRGSFRPARFLLVYAAVVFVFFSASSSKLPSYVLPAVPAIALLVGRYLPAAPRWLLLAQAVLAGVVALAAVLVSADLERFATRRLPAELLLDYAPWIAGAGFLLLAAAAVAAGAAALGRTLASSAALAAGGLVFVQLVMTGHEALSPAYSAYHTVERIRPALEEDERKMRQKAAAHVHAAPRGDHDSVPFYSVNTFDHSMPFYLGRTVTMVAYKDELAVPIGWEPHRFLPDIDAFVRAWQRDERAWAVLDPSDYERLKDHPGLAMRRVASDPRRVVVTKP